MIAVALSLSTPISAMNAPFEIEKFNSPPVIYFEKINDAYFSNTKWRILAYFDLKHFERELASINSSTLFLREQCVTKLNEYPECKPLVSNIEASVLRLLNKSELQTRVIGKRAALDIIGNIASDLFGVLDSRFAREYANDMEKLSSNDEHLMQLLKNQTSVIETATNVIKNQENDLSHQSSLINGLSQKIKDSIDREEAFQNFVLLVFYVHDLVEKLEHAHNAILNPDPNDLSHITTRQQLEKQVVLIQKHIDKSLIIPDLENYKLQ